MPLTTYTAGEVLTAASLNANFSFAAASGLTLISTTTIGTTVSSVTVSNAFSATYDTYKITISGGAASTSNALRLTLGATATGYAYQLNGGAYSNTPATVGASAQASWAFTGSGNTTSLSFNVNLLNPFLTEQTFMQGANIGATEAYAVEGFLNDTTSYTAFTITPSTGTITGGTIRVYGYANS
jgi:hypothetical protein